jgi:hypothetical protein
MKHIISTQNKLPFSGNNKFYKLVKGIKFFKVNYKHNRGLLIYIPAIFVLSIVDGLVTLELIYNGGCEFNPVMDFMLGISPSIFMISKLLFTIIGVGFLFITRNIHLKSFSMRVYVLFPIFAIIYGIVVCWGYFLNSIS